MADIKAIAAELVALTVQEVIDLKNELKETYGIEPAAAAVVVAAGGEGGAAAEEKTDFDELVDGAPSTLKEGMPKSDAEALKKTLEEAGAEIELK